MQSWGPGPLSQPCSWARGSHPNAPIFQANNDILAFLSGMPVTRNTKYLDLKNSVSPSHPPPPRAGSSPSAGTTRADHLPWQHWAHLLCAGPPSALQAAPLLSSRPLPPESPPAAPPPPLRHAGSAEKAPESASRCSECLVLAS